MQVRPQLQATSSTSPMAQMRAATGGVATGMSANAAASQLMIAAAAAAAGGQSYQYAALGSSQLLTQDSTGLGYPVSSFSCNIFTRQYRHICFLILTVEIHVSVISVHCNIHSYSASTMANVLQ